MGQQAYCQVTVGISVAIRVLKLLVTIFTPHLTINSLTHQVDTGDVSFAVRRSLLIG
jgi:hypothetical protein